MGKEMDTEKKRLKRRIAETRVSFEILEDFLQFPPFLHIIGVSCNGFDTHRKEFKILLEGQDCPECEEGDPFPKVEIIYHKPKIEIKVIE